MKAIRSLLFAIDEIPVFAVFLLTSLCGIISSIISVFASEESVLALIVYVLFSLAYVVGGIIFLILMRNRCRWNVLPLIIGLATVILSFFLISPESGELIIPLSALVSYFAMPVCTFFYFPLILYVTLVFIETALQSTVCAVMGILGILLTIYCIRNIIKNRPRRL